MHEMIDPKILMDERSSKIWKSDQNSVMNEEIVQNGAMNGQLWVPKLIRSL